MASLKSQAFRKVPRNQTSEIPTDVLSEIIDDYYASAWIIKTSNGDESNSYTSYVDVSVFKAKNENQAIGMWIDSVSQRENTIIGSIIEKDTTDFDFEEIAEKFQALLDDEQFEEYHKLVLDNKKMIIKYLRNSARAEFFDIKPFKFGKSY